MPGGDVGRNARVRAYKNPLLHKSNENIGKNCHNQLYQNSGNWPEVYNNSGSIYWRKRLNLTKNSKFCGIWTFPVPTLFFPLPQQILKSIPLQFWWKHSRLASSQWRKQNRVGVPLKPHSQKLSLFDLYGTSPENSIHQTCLFDLTQNSPGVNRFSWGCFSKIISSNCLTQQLFEATITVKTINKLTKT